MASTEHSVLFSMLYKVNDGGHALSMLNIANMVAYAQMYMCLPLVAAQIRECLLSRNNLWADVREQPLFHLGLAHKIRCSETYEDALRHLIGRGVHYSTLEPAGLAPGDAAMLVSDLRSQLESEIRDLEVKIDRLSLTDYVKHSDSKHPGPPVGTTLLSATWDIGLSTNDKAVWLAKGIFRDWYQLQLSGQHHWSHIRQYKYRSLENCDGYFCPSTLREVCEKVCKAHLEDRHLSLFESDAVERMVAEFGLENSNGTMPADVVTSTLTDIVKQVYKLSASLLGEKQVENPAIARLDIHCSGKTGSCAGRLHDEYSLCPGKTDQQDFTSRRTRRAEHAQNAKDEEDCCYFTHLAMAKEYLPWHNEPEWDDLHLEGLVSAPNEWLKAVDLIGDGVAEMNPFQDAETASESDIDW